MSEIVIDGDFIDEVLELSYKLKRLIDSKLGLDNGE